MASEAGEAGETGQGADRTLEVRFRRRGAEELEAVLAAFDQGDGPDSRFELTYDDPADVHVVTRPKSQELLRALLQHEPRSIRGTARVVGRDVSQVHRNLTELEELGLVEFVEDGDAKRPTVWYDAVEVTLPLGRPVVEPEERE